ncbi:hypothetical protein ACVW0Y_002066 [Pseudomonas sp. TE3786]
MSRIEKPTIDFVKSYLSENLDERYFGAEKALEKLFKAFPKNDDFDHLLLKTTCLNDLYRTRIINTYSVAKEIHRQKIDKK